MVNVTRAEDQLVLHEGLRTQPYVDTLGNWTIGVGYNITGRGYDFIEKILGRRVKPADGMTEKVLITRGEALMVLRADIERLDRAIPMYFTEYKNLNEVRQRVVLDMAFNMGFKVLGFRNTIAAVKRGDWSAAVKGLYASKWAYQVDDGPGAHYGRCDRLGRMLLTGHDYTV